VFDAAAPSIQPAQVEMVGDVKMGGSPALARVDEVVEQG
jgi:hypothetical protein